MFKKLSDRSLDWIAADPLRAALFVMGVGIGVSLLLWWMIGKAIAADATVNWTNPTQNTDNTAIPATGDGALVSTRIEYGTCSGALFGTKAGEVSVPQPSTSTVISGFSLGSTACFRAYAKNNLGVESVASAVASKTWPAPTPKPPVITTISGLVWELKLHPLDGPYLARVVGTVDAGKPCYGLAPQYGSNLFAVKRADIHATTGIGPNAALVAECTIT